MEECLFPYASASEINYVAFYRITAGYFNELYGYLNAKLASREGKEYLLQANMEDFFEKKAIKKIKRFQEKVRKLFSRIFVMRFAIRKTKNALIKKKI